jgi:Transposase DDE domain
MNNHDLINIFCTVDDFCINFEPEWKSTLLSLKTGKKSRTSDLCLSEIMTILIFFHLSGMKTFKQYYLLFNSLFNHLFPNLVSYNRFVELQKSAMIPMCAFIEVLKGECTGLSIIDATPLIVCHNKRIFKHKVFEGIAKRGKSTMGWFFGFKLHIVINQMGELLAFKVTPGNTADSKMIEPLGKALFGKMFGDKGYINQKIFKKMLKKGLQIVTQIRSNMKNKLMDYADRITLRKRSLVESVFHVLKDILNMDHTRHRSPVNFMTNLVGGLAAYCLSDKKPRMKMEHNAAGELILA